MTYTIRIESVDPRVGEACDDAAKKIITAITNYVEPLFIVLGGGILCAVLFIVSFITFLSKDNLRNSDYLEENNDKIESAAVN